MTARQIRGGQRRQATAQLELGPANRVANLSGYDKQIRL